MKNTGSEKWMLVTALVLVIAVATGCQPWQKKYETCVAEKENLEGIFEGMQSELSQCNSERDQLAQRLGMTQRELEDARKPKPLVKTGLEAEGGVYDAAKGTITVTIESGVLFDSGSANLKNEAKSKLGRISKVISDKYNGKEVAVVGHTDTDPIRKSKWKDNWELSTQRALSVTRYLVDRGVPAKQLTAAGRSQYHPVAGSKTASRRVEIVVYTR